MSYDYPMTGSSSPREYPYPTSASSSVSPSTFSVFSADTTLSQSSVASSTTSVSGWEPEESCTVYRSRARPNSNRLDIQSISRVNTYPQYQPTSACHDATTQKTLPPLRTADIPLSSEQRQHPRRRSVSKTGPPTLVRQGDRKVNFVDRLVYSATQMVEVIWPLSVPACRTEDPSGRGVLPLRVFIEETLRRSKTSYSTLQVALYYLILIKGHVPKHDFTMEQPQDGQCRALQCGRRMFLAALILASKYLQDRNYSSRAWSKISGLRVCEINANEMSFLEAINWKLHIPLTLWDRWQEVVFQYAPQPPPSSPGCTMRTPFNAWRAVLPLLTPELDSIELVPRTPTNFATLESAATSPESPLRVPSLTESTSAPTESRLPRFLEPKPDMLPPTPTLTRMRPLPTPVFTPQSTVAATPAVSAAAFAMRRPSMCSAMAQAQGSSLARCTMEWNPGFKGVADFGVNQPLARRPSLTTSIASSSSSPESMVSDSSSRSSRASSISSVSSAGWAPNQPTCLARLATCRSARLPYPVTLPKTKESSLEAMVADTLSSSPNMEGLYLDEDTPTVVADPIQADSIVSEDPRRSRKRGRSSVDIDLHQNVRHLLKSSRSTYFESPSAIRPDTFVAKSFLVSTPGSGQMTPTNNGAKALQSPMHFATERRLPLQKDLGRKRTCFGSEAAQTCGRLWEGALDPSRMEQSGIISH